MDWYEDIISKREPFKLVVEKMQHSINGVKTTNKMLGK